ncbi:MAG TPA: DUF4837 family protein [Bacteroidetes bacterium]|nr:DUF4837 family protein [Bacteroidota bacterium]
MKFKLSNSFFIGGMIYLALLMSGCSAEQIKSLQSVPSAFGESNRINVVADQDLWDGEVGDTFRFYYASPFLLLPQPEPIFDLRHFTPIKLSSEPLRKELRTYIFLADLNDEDSPTTRLLKSDIGEENLRRAKEDPKFNTTIGRDKWAKGQLLIYSFAYGQELLIHNIKKNFPALMKKIKAADRKQMESAVYVTGSDYKIEELIKTKFNAEMRIPKDYFVAVEDSNSLWLRLEGKKYSSNMIIHKLKYTDQSQLSKEGLKELRDSLGKLYITTEIDGAYMRTNDKDLPIFTKNINLNGNFALEARGIWDIVNDYMGGPFLSYIVQKKDTDQLLFIDGFIYAPGQEKRDYMQHLEMVISSLKF